MPTTDSVNCSTCIQWHFRSSDFMRLLRLAVQNASNCSVITLHACMQVYESAYAHSKHTGYNMLLLYLIQQLVKACLTMCCILLVSNVFVYLMLSLFLHVYRQLIAKHCSLDFKKRKQLRKQRLKRS